jgi:16S rRNA (adenine1518-N6/adenine1519-N6)-dimethyltransferase
MKRRRLGQHYLVDPDVIGRILSFAGIGSSDSVLEIGTGRGALTKELAKRGKSLVGYEIDRENFQETVEVVRGTGAKIVLADAFEQKPKFDVLVSSLPYSASASFVRWLCGLEFRRAVVVLQEDFIRKIMARPGERDYRGVSALVGVAFDVEVLGRVGRSSFSPPPRVSSVIVSFTSKRRVGHDEVSSIMRLFSLRRRRVDSALAELGMTKRGSFGLRRVNSLRPDEVHAICCAQ